MRVLHVCESTDGGVGRYLEAVGGAAARRGWDVTLASPVLPGAVETFAALGVRHVAWEISPKPTPAIPLELLALRRIVRQCRPDVVHLHSSKAGLVGRLLLRGHRPTIMQPHAWSFYAVHGAWGAGALRWERWAARWATVVVCVSRAERDIGRARGIDASYLVVPNGVDLSRFRAASAQDRTAARLRLGLPPGAPLAVCVGRLHRQKNQAALLEAWPDVRDKLPDARLVLVGEGPDRADLEAAAPDGVALVGAVPDTREWYAAADVVVQPSRWEGMSLAVLEAMATARPVVATDVPGMGEVVDPAAVVTPGDRHALADAVVARLADPTLAAREGAAARRRMEASHDLAAHVEQILDLEERLAGDHRGRG